MSVIYISNRLYNTVFCPPITTSFYSRQTHKDHRIGSLQFLILFILPYGEPLKQITSPCIFLRKEAFQHAHIQGLAKTPGTGNESDIIPIFPPFSDEPGLVDIERIAFTNLFKTLISDRYCCIQSICPLVKMALLLSGSSILSHLNNFHGYLSCTREK